MHLVQVLFLLPDDESRLTTGITGITGITISEPSFTLARVPSHARVARPVAHLAHGAARLVAAKRLSLPLVTVALPIPARQVTAAVVVLVALVVGKAIGFICERDALALGLVVDVVAVAEAAVLAVPARVLRLVLAGGWEIDAHLARRIHVHVTNLAAHPRLARVAVAALDSPVALQVLFDARAALVIFRTVALEFAAAVAMPDAVHVVDGVGVGEARQAALLVAVGVHAARKIIAAVLVAFAHLHLLVARRAVGRA